MLTPVAFEVFSKVVMSTHPEIDLNAAQRQLAGQSATEIVQWAADTFGSGLAMSTSFGIQSAVMLHLVTRVVPEIPIIWVDTGYLPPETYQFADELTQRLKLNLKEIQSIVSPARMEALYGRAWEQDDVEALNRYDQMRKVEPMQCALKRLEVTAWLAGLRSDQTDHRQQLPHIGMQSGRFKVLPILGWTSKDVYDYLKEHGLPYHPLWDEGYVTVGDWHSSRPVSADDIDERDTRFGGLKQECGLHTFDVQQDGSGI